MGDLLTPPAGFLLNEEARARGIENGRQAAADGRDPAKVKKSAQDMEPLFVYQLLSEMRKTVPEGGSEARTHEREMYNQMFDQAVAEQAAKRGDLGLADFMVRQLTGKASGPPDGKGRP